MQHFCSFVVLYVQVFPMHCEKICNILSDFKHCLHREAVYNVFLKVIC